MFKNVIAYKMSENFPQITIEQIQKGIFHPCENLNMSSLGFVDCIEKTESYTKDSLIYSLRDGVYLLKVKKEEKILPSSVVNDVLKEKIEKMTKVVCRKITKNEKLQLKDEVIVDLIPKAFSKYKFNYIWLDYNNKILYLDTPSYKQAEDLLALLRKLIGNLNLTMFVGENNIDLPTIMTTWLKEKQPPEKFSYLDNVVLKDNINESKISVSKDDLDSYDIQNHLSSGKLVSSLSLEYDQKLKFTLKSDFIITKIKINDMETYEQYYDAEDPNAEFNTELFSTTTNITNLILEFDKIFIEK